MAFTFWVFRHRAGQLSTRGGRGIPEAHCQTRPRAAGNFNFAFAGGGDSLREQQTLCARQTHSGDGGEKKKKSIFIDANFKREQSNTAHLKVMEMFLQKNTLLFETEQFINILKRILGAVFNNQKYNKRL